MTTFYSQQGEDVYIYRNFINKTVKDGIFLELGAMNGVTYSNTKFFEDHLQMSGILIEPTTQFKDLKINRPNCKCYNFAITCNNGPVKFIGNYATAGLIETMSQNFKDSWHKTSNEYTVEGIKMSDVINDSGAKYIDFLSIDVEGGEEVVLKTINFSIPIYLICIELDGHNLEKDNMCRQILKENGFTFEKRMCINEFWINKTYYRKDLLYDDSLPKQKIINSIYELGNFPYLERHVIPEVETNL